MCVVGEKIRWLEAPDEWMVPLMGYEMSLGSDCECYGIVNVITNSPS